MARTRRSPRPKRQKEVERTGLPLVDGLAGLPYCSMDDYLRAASEYVKLSSTIDRDERRARKKKKAAQIRLSNALGRVLAEQLKERLPELRSAVVGERTVSGALRTTRADVSEIHETDGLRLAVELKPVNLAVGRAIWNRFGDIRTFAVNLYLRFPLTKKPGRRKQWRLSQKKTKLSARSLRWMKLWSSNKFHRVRLRTSGDQHCT